MPYPPLQLVNLYANPLVNYHAAGHLGFRLGMGFKKRTQVDGL